MNRRNFLKISAALIAAPAIVKAGNIMRINPRIILPGSNIIHPRIIETTTKETGPHGIVLYRFTYAMHYPDGTIVDMPDGVLPGVLP